MTLKRLPRATFGALRPWPLAIDYSTLLWNALQG